jgi:hypothetical protein
MAEQAKQEDPGQAVKAKSMKEFEEKTKGKPTPTQEENDRAAMGEHVVDKEPDGSDEQPENSGPQIDTRGHRVERKQSEPIHTTQGGYQTRQTQPAMRQTPPRTSE